MWLLDQGVWRLYTQVKSTWSGEDRLARRACWLLVNGAVSNEMGNGREKIIGQGRGLGEEIVRSGELLRR